MRKSRREEKIDIFRVTFKSKARTEPMRLLIRLPTGHENLTVLTGSRINGVGSDLMTGLQLFRERLSNKTVRDN